MTLPRTEMVPERSQPAIDLLQSPHLAPGGLGRSPGLATEVAISR